MRIFLMTLFLLIFVNSYAQKKMDPAHKKDTISIALVVFEGMVLQDYAGPLEVFLKAKELTHGRYKIYTVGLTQNEILSSDGLTTVKPLYTFKNMPQANYIIFPGADMSTIDRLMAAHSFDQPILENFRKPETIVVSVCTGAYLLGNAGILNHKKATTHFFVLNDFSRLFPKVQMVKDVRFVQDGNIITSSGITSGIDAAMHIVRLHEDPVLLKMIARGMQYQFKEQEPFPPLPNGVGFDRNKKSAEKRRE